MRVGNYFVYCPLSSGVDMYVFRYTMIETTDKRNFISRYPVYLIVKPSDIYAAFVTNVPTVPGGKQKVHVNREIISIPFTDYCRRSTDPLSCFVRTNMHEPVTLSRDELMNKWLLQWMTVNNNKQSYFGSNEPASDACSILPARVFYDFLFDLFHSRVFDVQQGMDTIRQQLKSHYLCRALLSKQEYNYNQKLVSDRFSKNISDDLPAIYLDDFLKARKAWIESLDDEHGYYLYEAKKCFDPSLAEMRKVSHDDIHRYIKKYTDGDIQVSGSNHHMVSFFIERIAIKEAIVTLFKYSKGWAWFLTLLALIPAILILGYNLDFTNVFHFVIVALSAWGIFYGVSLPGLFTWTRFERKKLSLNSWAPVFFPFMTLGIIAAWSVYIPVSGDALKLSMIAPVFSKQYILLVILCFGFMLTVGHFTIKLKVPEYRWGPYSFMNSFFLCIAGISFSIFFGILIMHFNTRRLLCDIQGNNMPPGYFTQQLKDDIRRYDTAALLQNAFDAAIFQLDDTVVIKPKQLIPAVDSLLAFLKSPNIQSYSKTLPKILESNYTVKYYRSEWDKLYTHFVDHLYFKKIEQPACLLADRLKRKGGPQYIANLNILGKHWFYYPRLLLLFSFKAFYVGFLLQFIINFSNKHATRVL